MRALLAIHLLALAACISPASTFSCDNDQQCNGGVCQPATHFCSFSDPMCESGQAYDDAAGGLAGQCVPNDIPAGCGNGTVDADEDCEDGNTNVDDGCVNCRFARCGDGSVRAGIEDCDDGNTADGDNCNSICLDCSGGAASVVANGHCYMRFDTQTDFNTAAGDCATRGGFLALAKSQAENDVVTTLVTAGSGDYWIGLTDFSDTVLVWQDDEAATFTKFATGEPNGAAAEECFSTSAGGGWADRTCGATIGYVCERLPWTIDPTSRHAYLLIGGPEQKFFDAAQADCASRGGGHLASIVDTAEQTAVDAVSGASRAFIGLHAPTTPGQYEWTSGEPATFFNWNTAGGEPDQSGNCVTMRPEGTWQDEACTGSFEQGYLCEIDP